MSRRGLRGASLGKRNYPPESYYVEFDDLGTATGANSGRFNTWFSIQVKSRISYHLEWNEVTDEMKDKLWLCTEETWNFTPSSTAKTTHLKKANLIHGKFKSMLVTNYVRTNRLPFQKYPFMEDRHWIDFIASKSTEKFLSERAILHVLGRLRRNKNKGLKELTSDVQERLKKLSERAILHVLGRLRRNKNTRLKELTSDVQERLKKLVLKEHQIKADGSFFVAGKDPLIGVLGPEYPGRTRAVSSVVGFKKALGSVGSKRKKKVTIEDLEGMRAQMMEDMESIVRVKVMEELVVQGNNTTLQGPSIGHSDGHFTGHSTGVSAESVDTFDEIEILVMPHPGMYVERFFEYVEYSSLLAWMANSWLDGTLIYWWAIYLYGCVERQFASHNKCAILNINGDAAFDEKEPEFEGRKHESDVNVSPSSSAQSKKHDDTTKREAKGKSHVESSTGYRNLSMVFKDLFDNYWVY
nr:hypothetical protein [Tanacetum cinerariifolium]